MKEKIQKFITDYVLSHNKDELFRAPLIGFSSAGDERYKRIKEIIGPHHLYPTDILPTCKTVVSFFIPFTKKVVESNKQDETVSYLWAKTYYECNTLINNLTAHLIEYLKDFSVTAATVQATHGFDEELLKAPWSHKSAAHIAGLGEFGVNHLLITDKGCAGRAGTVFIDIDIEVNRKQIFDKSPCLYYQDGSCLKCVENCPTNALSLEDLNRAVCYEKCLDTDRLYTDIGTCDSCGKCSIGPCAYFE